MSASKIASVRRSRTAQRFALENRCQYILGMIGGTNEEREVLFAKARTLGFPLDKHTPATEANLWAVPYKNGHRYILNEALINTPGTVDYLFDTQMPKEIEGKVVPAQTGGLEPINLEWLVYLEKYKRDPPSTGMIGVVVKTPTPNIDTATEDPSSEDDEGAEEGSDSDIVDKVGYDFAEEDDDLYINTPVPPYCGRCPAPHQIQPQVKRLVDEGRLVFLDYSLQDRHLGWYEWEEVPLGAVEEAHCIVVDPEDEDRVEAWQEYLDVRGWGRLVPDWWIERMLEFDRWFDSVVKVKAKVAVAAEA